MSIHAINWAFAQSDIQSGPRFTLVAIADHADANGVCWPSVGQIMRKTGFSDRAVRSHIKQLTKLGKLRVDYLIDKKGQTSSTYTLAMGQEQSETVSPAFYAASRKGRMRAPANRSGGRMNMVQGLSTKHQSETPTKAQPIAREPWGAPEQKLRSLIGDAAFNAWFSEVNFTAIPSPTLWTGHEFLKRWIEDNYRRQLELSFGVDVKIAIREPKDGSICSRSHKIPSRP